MELKVEIGYEQVLDIVKQLPVKQIEQLVMDAKTILERKKTPKDSTAFQQFLLTAPRMTDEQYETFLENRTQWNQWRTE